VADSGFKASARSIRPASARLEPIGVLRREAAGHLRVRQRERRMRLRKVRSEGDGAFERGHGATASSRVTRSMWVSPRR